MSALQRIALLALAISLLALPAWAATKAGDKEIGGQISVGTTTSSVEGGGSVTNTTTAILASFGYFTTKALQVGGSVAMQGLKSDDAETSFTFLEGFVKYHFNTDTATVPYVGALLGTVNVKFSGGGTSETSSGTTMGAMAGVKFYRTEDLSINAEYNIRNFTITIAGADATSTTGTALVGLSYYFR
jgi:opacity protein-like surface antigen